MKAWVNDSSLFSPEAAPGCLSYTFQTWPWFDDKAISIRTRTTQHSRKLREPDTGLKTKGTKNFIAQQGHSVDIFRTDADAPLTQVKRNRDTYIEFIYWHVSYGFWDH